MPLDAPQRTVSWCSVCPVPGEHPLAPQSQRRPGGRPGRRRRRRTRGVLQDHSQRSLSALLTTPPACWAPRIGPWNPKSYILSVAYSWSTILPVLPATCCWQTARSVTYQDPPPQAGARLSRTSHPVLCSPALPTLPSSPGHRPPGSDQGSAGCHGGRLWPGAAHTSPWPLLEVGTAGEVSQPLGAPKISNTPAFAAPGNAPSRPSAPRNTQPSAAPRASPSASAGTRPWSWRARWRCWAARGHWRSARPP